MTSPDLDTLIARLKQAATLDMYSGLFGQSCSEAATALEQMRAELARFQYPPEHLVSVAEAERDSLRAELALAKELLKQCKPMPRLTAFLKASAPD